MKLLVGLSVVLASTAAALAKPFAAEAVRNGVGPVHFLRFAPSGRELVRVCVGGDLEMFDVDGYRRARTIFGATLMVAYSADGQSIVTAEGCGGARVWNTAVPNKTMPTVREVHLLDVELKVLEAPRSRDLWPEKPEELVHWTEFSSDGKRLVTTQANGHVKVWVAATWTVECDLALTKGHVRTAAFAPDGATIVFGDDDGFVHEWNFERKSETRTSHADGAVVGVAFAPDGKTLVTTHGIGPGRTAVVIWDADRKVVETKPDVASAAYSKDGKTLAIGGANVELFDAATRKSVRVIELPEMTMREVTAAMADSKDPDADKRLPVLVTALAFSPDGATLAAGCHDGTVRLLKTASEK